VSLDALSRPWICLWARRHFSDLVDGDLSPRGVARSRRHLARCRSCRRVWETLVATVAGLNALGSMPTPAVPSVAERVARRIGAPPENHTGGTFPPTR